MALGSERMSDAQLKWLQEELRDLELRLLWLMEHGVGRCELRRRCVLARIRKLLSTDPRVKVLKDIRGNILFLRDQLDVFEEEEV